MYILTTKYYFVTHVIFSFRFGILEQFNKTISLKCISENPRNFGVTPNNNIPFHRTSKVVYVPTFEKR